MGVSSFLKNVIFFVSLCCLFWSNCICDNVDSGTSSVPFDSEYKQTDPIDRPSIASSSSPPSENINVQQDNVIIFNSDESSHSSSQSQQSISSNTGPETKPSDNPVKIPKFGEPFKKIRRKESTDQIVKTKKVKLTQSAASHDTDVAHERLASHNEDQKTSETSSSESPDLSMKNQLQDNIIIDKSIDVVDESTVTHIVQKDHITPTSIDKIMVTEASSPNNAENSDIPQVKDSSSHIPPLNADSSDQSHHHHHDAMPSFDEWKKMMLAEQQKGGHAVPSSGPPGKKIASQKRRRNYASYECGSKIVASNAEGEGATRILNELVDEYMLNPCKAKIWFIIELCESVQASQIELANFELFSSCPKEFAVYSSDNFPTRDWIPLGTFTASEQRVLQSFPLKQEGFGKFIKIELLSHYGKEHYCPLSVVRIFGTSMVDEYEEMETLSSHHVPPEDELDRLDLPVEDKSSSNLFGSATDAVYSIVKKAAQVLGPRDLSKDDNEEKGSEKNISSDECKLINDSCTDGDKSNRVTDPDFFLSATSMKQSLFRHLRHCDQCIYMSRPSYYSVSPPECRFFQAALGPVLFNTICDWFKNNVISPENVPVEYSAENSTIQTSKPTSLPPTIISVIIDHNGSATLSSISKKTPSLPSTEELPSDSSKLKASVKSVKTSHVHSEGDSEMVISPTKTLPSSQGEPRASYSDSVKTDTVDIPFDSDKGPVKAGVEYAGSDSISSSYVEVTASATAKDSLPSASQDSIITISQENITKDSDSQPDISKKIHTNKLENVTQAKESPVNDAVVPTSIVDSGIDDYSEELRSVDERFVDVRDPGMTTVVTSATLAQKESVFMRMSNRIKALELNMSLSSQYLQELSQRYRRQMEEMQRAFNRTIGTLNDTARKAAEKDMKQQEVISQLQSEVANLTVAVEKLISDQDNTTWRMVQTYVLLIILQAIVVMATMPLYARRFSFMFSTRVSTPEQIAAGAVEVTPSVSNDLKRRNSTDVAPVAPAVKIQRRSVSEEVIPSGDEPVVIEPVVPKFAVPAPKVKKKSRRRKGIHRSASNPTMSPRKNAAISSSFDKKLGNDETLAAGIIFSNANPNGIIHNGRKVGHVCENCKGNVLCNMPNQTFFSSKTKRPPDCEPLKNLTNGKCANHIGTDNEESSVNERPVKEKFTFKKFLRLQKRESI